MPYRRSVVTPSSRAAIIWPAVALLFAAGTNHFARAEPFPRDPVTEFRQALIQEKDTVRDKEALRFRRENLSRKAKELTSLGEMSRVLLLQEWRVEGIGEVVADIDREVRDGIADRFIAGLKEAMASGDIARSESAAELISETANAARTPGSGFKAGFLRQRLAAMAPEIAKLTQSTDPKVQQFAAEALGNVQGDPKLTVQTLGALIKDGAPQVRRTAAFALGNVIQIVSQLEKKVRSGEYARGDLRKDLLTTGMYLVKATETGFSAKQPVEVRRLSADALQQLTSSLVDLIQDPIAADKYPPPGRPWTETEARQVDRDREDVSQEREELRPLLDAIAAENARLAVASSDPDPYTRIAIRRVLEDVAIARLRLRRREAGIPRGEGVPAPRPDPKPGEKKDGAPKTNGVFLPSGTTPSGAPILLVGRENQKPAAASASTDIPGASLQAALSAVLKALNDPNVRARLGAMEVLEALGDDAAPAIPALVDSLKDSDRFVRWAAIRTLGRLAPRSPELVVPALARVLNDDDLDVEVATANTLERYGPLATAAVKALGERASRGDADIRIAAMKAIESIGTDAAPALLSVAQNLVSRDREQRGQEIGPDSGATPPARTRVAAAETLGRFGKLAVKAVPLLQQSLSDSDSDVRRAAAEAILKITSK